MYAGGKAEEVMGQAIQVITLHFSYFQTVSLCYTAGSHSISWLYITFVQMTTALMTSWCIVGDEVEAK